MTHERSVKIFLDTNIVTPSDYFIGLLFNERIGELSRFLADHRLENVNIYIPEIVIRERIQQVREEVGQKVNTINETINSYKSLLVRIGKAKTRTSLQRVLRSQASSFIKKHKITAAPLPVVDSNNLIDRALAKRPPFNTKGAGFKDALIYLTMLHDAQISNTDIYILCSNDKGFTESLASEFNVETNKQLIILKEIAEVIVKLDEVLILELHLKERNRKIKNLLADHISDVIEIINQSMDTGPGSVDFEPYRLTWSGLSGVGNNIGGKPVAYSYGKSDIENVTEKANGELHVDCMVTANIVYKENQEERKRSYLYEDIVNRTINIVPNQYEYRPTKQAFALSIICDIEKNTLQIINATPTVAF